MGRTRSNHIHVMSVSLKEAFMGVNKTLRVNVLSPCHKCVKTCSGCGGTGNITRTNSSGMFTQIMQMTCVSCGGKGTASTETDVCESCGNTRQQGVEHVLVIEIPRGMHTGHRECFRGMGEQIMSPSETPGDLIVEVNVQDDASFVRSGDDLLFGVTISLWESITGKVFVVPMFGGDLTFNTTDIDTGIMQPSKRYVLTEFGMPMCRGPSGMRGTLILTFTVTYPTSKLSDEERARLTTTIKTVSSVSV